jgi:hypothetical protein
LCFYFNLEWFCGLLYDLMVIWQLNTNWIGCRRQLLWPDRGNISLVPKLRAFVTLDFSSALRNRFKGWISPKQGQNQPRITHNEIFNNIFIVEECHILGCAIMWVYYKPTFQRNVWICEYYYMKGGGLDLSWGNLEAFAWNSEESDEKLHQNIRSAIRNLNPGYQE